MIKTIRDVDFNNKIVLCRVDYNVPIENNEIKDDTRMVESLPTLKFMLDNGAKLILMSHLGRPKGPDPSKSLRPVAKHLEKLLNQRVVLSNAVTGEETDLYIQELKEDKFKILMLENTRFDPGETKNDPQLSQSLAKCADIYVSDAFGTAHRAHASTEGVSKYLPSYAGFLIEKEYNRITAALNNPQKPALAIVGGAKVSTKLEVIEEFIKKMDDIIIGGGMAFTFLKSLGKEVGKSLVEEEMLEKAGLLLTDANSKGVNIHLPLDIAIASSFDQPILDGDKAKVVDVDNIPSDTMGLDIGEKSISQFSSVISRSNTIIWNGPMGVFEKPYYSKGTIEIAKKVVSRNVSTVIGGGDTLYALNVSGITSVSDKIHVSTGGGASLELMSGIQLPGIACLQGEK